MYVCLQVDAVCESARTLWALRPSKFSAMCPRIPEPTFRALSSNACSWNQYLWTDPKPATLNPKP